MRLDFFSIYLEDLMKNNRFLPTNATFTWPSATRVKVTTSMKSQCKCTYGARFRLPQSNARIRILLHKVLTQFSDSTCKIKHTLKVKPVKLLFH